MSLHVSEAYGSTYKRSYHIEHFNSKCITREENTPQQSLTSFFLTAFLPHGYPDSVSKDYLQYQLWDSIQAFASSITGSICTHAILKGVGVGDENASSLAATMTWLLKDGVSMLGRIAFAWLQGTKLDSDCKKWRLFADVLNDLAQLMDLLSAYFQNHFMLIICISGLMKSLVGVAGGCTRAALTQHQARKNNMADVSAKDGSQETLVNLAALLCSLVILPVVTKSTAITWTLYIMMTTIHLCANYCAIKSVKMETFNEARFNIYTSHYFTEGMTRGNFLTVSEVNTREGVFFTCSERVQIKLGSSFKNIIQGRGYKEVKDLLDLYGSSNYILRISRRNPSRTVIYIAFNESATILTQMEAFYQACFIQHLLQQSHIQRNDKHFEADLEASSREYAIKTFSEFRKSLEIMKFNINTVIFNTDSWRAEW